VTPLSVDPLPAPFPTSDSLPVTLRRARVADVPSMAVIESGAFSDPWPASAFQALMARDYVITTVAVDDGGSVRGYCVLLRAADEAEIANIATEPSARRQGVARRLLAHALDIARAEEIHAVFLEVRVSNRAAQGLYGSLGFEAVGRRKRYYQYPDEDALVLRCTLHPPYL